MTAYQKAVPGRGTAFLFWLSFLIPALILSVSPLLGADGGKGRERLVFPFMRSLYTVDPVSLEGRCLHRFSSAVSGEYRRLGGGYLFQLPRQNQLVQLTPSGKLQSSPAPVPFIKGYFPEGAAVWITDQAGVEEQGFLWKVYSRREGQLGESLSEFRLDLFPSDAVAQGSLLFVAGSTRDDRCNRVYRISAQGSARSGDVRKVWEQARTDDFLKMVSGSWKGRPAIFVYASVKQPEPGNTGITVLSGEGVLGEGVLEWQPEVPEGWSFFGRGFFQRPYLYLPVLNQEGEAALLRCLPGEARQSIIIELPRGVFSPLSWDSSAVVYIGHNFFRDRGVFSLVRLSLSPPFRAVESPMP